MGVVIVNEGEKVLYRCNGMKSCRTSPNCGINNKDGRCTETTEPEFANKLYMPRTVDFSKKFPVIKDGKK